MKRLTQKDVFSLVVFQILSQSHDYPANMLKIVHKKITHRPINRRHFYATITQLHQNNLIKITNTQAKRLYYTITDNGREEYQQYKETFQPSISVIKETNNRLLRVLRHQSLHPYPAVILKPTYRSFFSRIFSVKDILRYYTLHYLRTTKRVYMGEIKTLIKNDLGWVATEGYIYDIAHEMEENDLIRGKWDDENKRTMKFYSLTDDGAYYSHQIETSLLEMAKQNHKYLSECFYLFHKD